VIPQLCLDNLVWTVVPRCQSARITQGHSSGSQNPKLDLRSIKDFSTNCLSILSDSNTNKERLGLMDATGRRPYMFLHLRVMLSGIYAQKEGAGQPIATLLIAGRNDVTRSVQETALPEMRRTSFPDLSSPTRYQLFEFRSSDLHQHVFCPVLAFQFSLSVRMQDQSYVLRGATASPYSMRRIRAELMLNRCLASPSSDLTTKTHLEVTQI
jgi:hypothetical protein